MPNTSPPARRAFAASVVALALIGGPTALATVGQAPSPGAAGSSGEAGTPRSREVALQVGPTLPGIDVSHWQGTIDWRKVAGAGKRFVFLKATDGHDFVDPTFVANRAGARANGLSVGAYHFARPDPSKGDAAEEARWFVSRARPKSGNLLPVLDLETSQGLDQAGVTMWAQRWVAEVRRLTGVTALVYTSPYGWMSRTGDSRALARDGSPLWVAHWGVASPTLPAGGWAGNGWRVWQHTSSGHVAGIAGRVDLDVMAGRSLGPITIRRLELDVRGDAGKVVSAPSGLGCRGLVHEERRPRRGSDAHGSPRRRLLLHRMGRRVLGHRPHLHLHDARQPVRAGELRHRHHRASGRRHRHLPVARAGRRAVRRAGTGGRPGERDAAPGTWCTHVGDPNLPIGSRRERRVQRGRAIRDLGAAASFVPGRNYEAVVNPPGSDPVVDRAGNVATPTVTPVEGPLSVQQGHEQVALTPARAWRSAPATQASGGSFALSERAGAAAELRFDGVGIDWVTVTGPNRGRARISIDGAPVRVVDLYSATRTFGVVQRLDGLADGAHSLRIEVLGPSSPVSRGRWIAVDRFDVLAT